MIDLRYHITSIVAVFLALGLGVLIGSTIVGDDLLVDQQKKMLTRLEEQFDLLKEKEDVLLTENEQKNEIITNYENYSQALLPILIRDRLVNHNLAIVVSGNSEIPAGMINALNLAGAHVTSKSVILANMNLEDKKLRQRVSDFYNLPKDTAEDVLRQYIASSIGAIITHNADKGVMAFLEETQLVKFGGEYGVPVNGVILVGGTNSLNNYFARSFDQKLIENLLTGGTQVYGVESSGVDYSYMSDYQKNNMTTIDNIDISPGQISLVFALEGETGNYGIKATADKFIPSLPLETLGSIKR